MGTSSSRSRGENENPMKSTLLLVTRFLPREQPKEFLKAIETCREGWSNIDLEIECHGKGTLPDIDIPVHDCRDIPTCPLIYKYGITEAKNRGYEYIGFIDDDAYFKRDPSAIFERAVSQGARAFGPVTPGRASMVFRGGLNESILKHRVDDEFYRIDHLPWCTLGCQVYKTSDVYSPELFDLYEKLAWRCDSITYMHVHSRGGTVFEFLDSSYVHTGGYGSLSKVMTKHEYDRILERIKKDYTELGKYSRNLGDAYFKQIQRACLNEVRSLNKKFHKDATTFVRQNYSTVDERKFVSAIFES